MTKSATVSKLPRKQYSPEYRSEAMKLAERIGVAAAARELSLYESQLYAWRSKNSAAENVLRTGEWAGCRKRPPEAPAGGTGRGVDYPPKAATYFAKRLK